MSLFSPYKRQANAFRYTPRFFDPDKERMDQRRKELSGQSIHDSEKEYQPGQFIRTQRDARMASKPLQRKGGASNMVIMGGVALLAMLIFMIYPKLVETFARARTTPEKQAEKEYREFDPYAPITIVPNDYTE